MASWIPYCGSLTKKFFDKHNIRAEDYFNEKANNLAKELLGTATIENGIKIVSMRGVRLPDLVKTVAFNVRALSPEHTAFIGATTDPSGKPLLTVMLTEDLVKSGLNASTIVREAAKSIKGGGGRLRESGCGERMRNIIWAL